MDLKDLEYYVANCRNCELYKGRNKYVLGDGNIESSIMLIGEGPGEQEDLQGKAFVGPSGMLLDKMLAAIGLDRTSVYICNIVKCRPPKNRNPKPDEQAACMDYLRAQFKIMRPRIVLLLGSIACKAILSPDFSVMKDHGQIINKQGVTFIPTFHPSALLRDPSKKILAWYDLKILRDLIDQMGIEREITQF